MSEEKVIELSKTKILLFILVAIGAVALGVWLLTLDADVIRSQRKYNDPLFVRIMGVALVALFSIFGAILMKKYFDKKPGLTINSQGIVDNSSGDAVGMVLWTDVVGLKHTKISGQKMLSIEVSNPEKYISRGNLLQKATRRANNKLVGTPVNISANSLKINYDELVGLIGQSYIDNTGNQL